MDVVASSPGRAELLGNHTDYNEGLVLAVALDMGTTLQGRSRPDQTITLVSEGFSGQWEGSLDAIEPVTEPAWANYVLGVIAGFQERGARGPGFDISISSTVPPGSGLSSSAALECATARFLQSLWSTTFSALELARIGQAAEHRFVGVKCGLLDQIASLFGRPGHLVHIDCRSFEVELLPAPPDLTFIMAGSGVQHALVAGEYNERRASCEAAAHSLGVPALRDVTPATLKAEAARLEPRLLARARHIVGENDRVARARAGLLKGDVSALGAAMFESHESSRINFENSCPELDALVAIAHSLPGCLGARLSGGGFGGATINLVEERLAASFKAELTRHFEAQFGRAPSLLESKPSGIPLDA